MFVRTCPQVLTTVMCVSLLLVAGCGERRPSLVKATVAVTLDGNAVGNASVMFHPDDAEFNRVPSANIDAAGKGVVGSWTLDDGLPAGTYKVTVNPPPMSASPIPEIYFSKQNSPINVTIDNTTKEVKVELLSTAGSPAQVFEIGNGAKALDPMEMMRGAGAASAK